MDDDSAFEVVSSSKP